MSSFTDATFEPTGQYREGRVLYKITGGFQFDIGFLGSGLCIKVPNGFITDGPSIPTFLYDLLPVTSIIKSSSVHDVLREDLRYSKLEGDAIFLTAMAAEGAPKWFRELAFLATRLNDSRQRAI